MIRSFDWQKGIAVLIVLGIAALGTLYLRSKAEPAIQGSIPKANLPAYHLITSADLIEDSFANTDLPPNVVLQETDLVGRYTRKPLMAKIPVSETQLVPPIDAKYVMNTVALPIPASATMAYNGQLAPGTIVKLWSITDDKLHILLDEALVLDVQSIAARKDQTDDIQYSIVLAVPLVQEAALIVAIRNTPLSLTVIP